MKQILFSKPLSWIVLGLFLLSSFNIHAQSNIGDYVWNDINGNGIQEIEEPGLPDVTVEIFLSNSNLLIASTTSDGNGSYLFSDIDETLSYYLKFTPSIIDYKSTINILADPTNNSDITNAFGDGTTSAFIPSSVQTDMDAGFAMCQSMSCLGSLNLSVNADCEAVLIPSMLLTAPQFDNAAYTIMIKDLNGNVLPYTTFSSIDVGKTFMVNIISDICENECWMNITVEDKMPPVMVCDTIYTSCFMDLDSIELPNIIDNCGDADLLLLNETHISLDCDSLYTGKVHKTWTAIDKMGNKADSCVQVVMLMRINLDSLTFPNNLTVNGNNNLSCSGNYDIDDNGNPAPSVTGFPTLELPDGTILDLDTIGGIQICNAFVTYKDKVLPNIGCTTKVLRTWRIGEWYCGTTVDTIKTQMIEITDNEGPVVSTMDTIVVSTSGGVCTNTMSIPLPEATDNCCDDFTYDLTHPGGLIKDYTNQLVTLPAGINTIYIKVFDCCGNETTTNVIINVIDQNAPVALCHQYTTVSLTTDGITYLPAASLDEGSYDDCENITISVARMDDGIFGPYVVFDCIDADKSIMVILSVFDGYNTNTCMVEVEVQDKLVPVLSCPANITVECKTPYDADDLISSFGGFDFTDNCFLEFDYTDVLTGSLDACGKGDLTRKITLFDTNGNQLASCNQIITFDRPQQDPIIVDFSDITNYTINGCPDDITLAEPTWNSGQCDLMAYTVETDTFQYVDGACYKLVNYYTVINWCTYKPNDPQSTEGIWTYTQVIKVLDDSKPVISQRDDVIVAIASTVGDCIGDVVLTNSATDTDGANCPNTTLEWQIFVDLNGNNVNELSFTRTSQNGEDVSVSIPNLDGTQGNHSIRWIVEDACGNSDAVSYRFVPEDNVAPTPYCHDISTAVMAIGGTVDLWAIDFNEASFDNCTPMEQLRYTFTSTRPEDDADYNSASRSSSKTFTCDDVANSPFMLDMYVWDAAGNSDFCSVELTITDNNQACGPIAPPINDCTCAPTQYTGWAVATCNTDHDDSGVVGVIYDVRNTATAPKGQNWSSALGFHPSNWTITEIGQIFGIALDGEESIFLAASDIYDTQFDTDPYGPGQIFKANKNNGFMAVPFVELPNTGGSLNGIGNIVYCKDNNMLYASNLEDGNIYRIDASGNVMETYDPWADDDGSDGIVDPSEQVWALGLNKENGVKKLYFPRVGGGERAMFSIALNADGSFPALNTEEEEFENIMGVGLRISDIDFNAEGNQMIFSERGTKFTSGAHDSKTLRYDLNGSWSMAVKYFVGGYVSDDFPDFTFESGENSAGGVSFGSTNVTSSEIQGCDELVWASMNYYEDTANGLYYGMQGMNAEGNNSVLSATDPNSTTDIVIDYDGVTDNFDQKGDIGDIEIFRCGTNSGNKMEISGRVATLEGLPVENAEVSLLASLPDYPIDNMSNYDGGFNFADIPAHESYKVESFKNDERMNGVSTLDLVMIQRHILEIQTLNNPYSLIAADVNKDDKIKSSDLLALRKLILGVESDFPEENSWRFVNSDFTFADYNDPWTQPFDEDYRILNLSQNMVANFIAIKIGDVNGSFESNVKANSNSENRSENTSVFSIVDRQLVAGQEYIIDIIANQNTDLYGLQLMLSTSNLNILEVINGDLLLNKTNYTIGSKGLAISYSAPSGDAISSDAVLFTLKIRANSNDYISNMVSIDTDMINAEAYIGNQLEISTIQFAFDRELLVSNNLLILNGNKPNPWGHQTDIDFTIPVSGNVTLNVYNLDGKLVLNKQQVFSAGNNSFTVSDNEISTNGLLFYDLSHNNIILKGKMIKLK